jgi:hypothetical protein
VGPDGYFKEKIRFNLTQIGLDKEPKGNQAVYRKNSLLKCRLYELFVHIKDIDCLAGRKFYGEGVILNALPGLRNLTAVKPTDDFDNNGLYFLAYYTLCQSPLIDRERRPGYRFLDYELLDTLACGQAIRRFLLPALRSGKFREFLVKFSSLPHWLPEIAKELFMTYEIKINKSDYTLVIIRPDHLSWGGD